MREMLRQKAGLVLVGCLTLGATSLWLFGSSGSGPTTIALVGAAPRKALPTDMTPAMTRKPTAAPSGPVVNPGERKTRDEVPDVVQARKPKRGRDTTEKLKKVSPAC